MQRSGSFRWRLPVLCLPEKPLCSLWLSQIQERMHNGIPRSPSLLILVCCLWSQSYAMLRIPIKLRENPLQRASKQMNFLRQRCVCFSSKTSGDVPRFESNQHSKVYRLGGVGRRSQVNITTDTGHELRTDVPKKMGGSDTAPQPVETLLAAWMGCTQATALFVGRQMSPRIILESLAFESIEAARDERGAHSLPIDSTPTIPSRIQRVSGIIRVITLNKEPLSYEQMKLLKEQTEIRCPIANMMIASGCSMEVEWVEEINNS